jgi:hypothetical protein
MHIKPCNNFWTASADRLDAHKNVLAIIDLSQTFRPDPLTRHAPGIDQLPAPGPNPVNPDNKSRP